MTAPRETNLVTSEAEGRSETPDTLPAGKLRQDGRREFIGRSGKLLIYTPPLIQLFIPTKAMAATPSSG